MKKLLSLLIIATLCVSMLFGITACSEEDYHIGILQVATHTALDAARKGFEDALNEWAQSNGKVIKFTEQNANGSAPDEITLADSLVASSPNLVLGIATSSAQALQSSTTKIPVLFTAVTSPVGAGLTNANVTGTSDLNPVADQIALIETIISQTKPDDASLKVAFIYNSSEDNSVEQINLAKAKCAELDIDFVDITVSDEATLQTVIEGRLSSDIDAIYVPTDNLLAKNISVVYGVATPLSIPIIVGESGMCEDGEGLATFGINYEQLGRQTAAIAIKILEGTSPSEIPFEYASTGNEFFINETNAAAIGMTTAQIAQIKAQYQD